MNLKVFDVSLEGVKRFQTLYFTLSVTAYMVIVLLTSPLDHGITVEQTSFLSVLACGRFSPHVLGNMGSDSKLYALP